MPTRAFVRRCAAPAVAVLALALGGCGMDAQTLKPYTQSQGINAQAKDVIVRNLLLIADASGKGVLSATLIAPTNDTLATVTAIAQHPDGTDAGSLQVTGTPVTLAPNQPVVLTGPPPAVKVSGTDLKPGLTAKVTLQFGSGATVTVVVPVAATTDPAYRDLPLG